VSSLAAGQTKAIELVKEAVAADNAQNYEEALRLYKASLEHFSLHLKYEKNPTAKKTITAKARCAGGRAAGRCCGGERRAEPLRGSLSSSPSTWRERRSCKSALTEGCSGCSRVQRLTGARLPAAEH